MRQMRNNSIPGSTLPALSDSRMGASRVGCGASPRRPFSFFRFWREFVAAEKFAMARAHRTTQSRSQGREAPIRLSLRAGSALPIAEDAHQ